MNKYQKALNAIGDTLTYYMVWYVEMRIFYIVTMKYMMQWLHLENLLIKQIRKSGFHLKWKMVFFNVKFQTLMKKY